MRPGTKAWLGMGTGILAYELACPEGELLSEAVDRALESHPIITTTAIGATALHLANKLPNKLDPFSLAIPLLRRLY